jgi:hypothetical protein
MSGHGCHPTGGRIARRVAGDPIRRTQRGLT